MRNFDIHEWNSKRIRESIENDDQSVSKEQLMYDIYDAIVAEMGDSFKAEFVSATDFERRMRRYLSNSNSLSEGALDRDQIAQKMFSKEYRNCSPDQQEVVDKEYQKDINHR